MRFQHEAHPRVHAHEPIGPQPDRMLLEPLVPDPLDIRFGHHPPRTAGQAGVDGEEVGPGRVEHEAQAIRIEERWTGIREHQMQRCAEQALQQGTAGVIVVAVGADRAESVCESVKRGLVNTLVQLGGNMYPVTRTRLHAKTSAFPAPNWRGNCGTQY